MKRRLALLALLGAVSAAAVALRLALGDRVEPRALVALLRELGGQGWAMPAYVALFGVASTVFVPAMSLVVVACVTWGFWPGILVAWLTENLWANVQFVVGRALGRERLEAALARRGVTRVLRELEHGGVLATLMVRQLPLPFVAVNVAAGVTPLRWHRWAIGNALGLVPGVLVIGHLAASLADGVEGARAAAGKQVALGAALVVTLALATRALLAWWEKRRRSSADVA
jgi:phospholipase D1/2